MHPDPQLLGAAVRLAVSALVLFAAIEFIVEPTMAEGTRQRLFRLRRDMFLYMAGGGIDPSHRAYTDMRMTMNGGIRFAERLTFGRAMLMRLFLRRQIESYGQRMEESFATLDEQQLAAMCAFRDRLHLYLAIHIFTSSVLGWIFFVPMFLYGLSKVIVDVLVRRTKRATDAAKEALRKVSTDAIQADAESLGEEELPVPLQHVEYLKA